MSVAFAGPAGGEQIRLEEDLRGPDDLQDHRHEQDSAELRQRDVPDLAQDSGAVDRGSLVELGVHGRQRCEVDDHCGAGVRPGRLEHERRHRRARGLEPGVRTEVRPAENRVEDADRATVVEGLPEEHCDDRWDDDRQVRERAVPAARPPHLTHQYGRDERDRITEHEREQGEVHRVLDRNRQQRVVENLAEVVEPDPRRRLHQVGVLQRHDHRAHDRVPREGPEDEQHRKQEEERGETAAAHPGHGSVPGATAGPRVINRGPFHLDLTRPQADGHPLLQALVAAGGGELSPAAGRTARKLTSAGDSRLGGAVRLLQHRLDVGVLVRQHCFDHRVE